MSKMESLKKFLKEILWFYNDLGEIRVRISITEKCQQGVYIWKKARWRRSVNLITPDGVSDIGDQAIYNECLCNIRKL